MTMTTAPEIVGGDPYVEPDERDAAILTQRVALLDEIDGPRVGDFVRYPDWTVRRISHVWDFGDGDDITVQTSNGGSFYLGAGYVSFSGSLFPGIPGSTLTLTDELAMGAVWFFHHDHHRAHNAVQASVPFRVFICSMGPNR